MAHRKDLAGNLEINGPHQARRAQTAVYLRSLKNRRVQIGIIFCSAASLISRSRRRACARAGSGANFDRAPCRLIHQLLL